MAANIVTSALASDPDMVVAGRVSGMEDVEAELRTSEAEAVLLHGDQVGDRDTIEHLLLTFPKLKVVTIDASGRGGCLHELRVCAVRLQDLSGDLLRRALLGQSLDEATWGRPQWN